MLDYKQLVAERNQWVKTNFPDQEPGTDSVFGVMEEVGELAHAHLKQKQGIRMNEDHDAKAKDAIGDVIIYLLGVMNYHQRYPTADFKPTLRRHEVNSAHSALLQLGGSLGNLCRETDAEERGGEAIGVQRVINKIVYYCQRYCDLRGWDFDAIVLETWKGVKKRDWIANPDDADVKAQLAVDPFDDTESGQNAATPEDDLIGLDQ